MGKIFDLADVLEQYPLIRKQLPKMDHVAFDVAAFRFAPEKIVDLNEKLDAVYQNHRKSIDRLLDSEIRPSGVYQLYDSLDNRQLWLKCWKQYFNTVNYCIDVYGLGKKLRYPAIDSASYDVKSDKYQSMMREMLRGLELKKETPFYEAPMKVVLGLLALNGRDEAVRYEPLESGENKAARKKAAGTDFSVYPYTVIVVPGEGPGQYGVRISEESKKRCRVAAERFGRELAPFIVFSGGNCHPFRTEFNEALEMRRFLVDSLGIAASSVIMDPHARHTTTNFRNAGRLLVSYGFPLDKPAMLVTTLEQADYIAHPKFGERNIRELGYLPYRELERLSELEFSFFVVREVLTRDAVDPLDP